MSFSRPSSTITAATLAGLGTAFAWQLVETFTDVVLAPGLIAGSTAFVSALVGYLKPERVLHIKKD